MTQYEVTIKEVFSTTITVTADSIEEALALAERGIEEGLDEEPTYDYTLDSGEWTVEKVG